MKKITVLLSVLVFLIFPYGRLSAQSCSILYFCVKYDGKEIECSDRFTTGSITVMARLNGPVSQTKVFIQLEKYNPEDGSFKFYRDFDFDVDADLDYIYFNDVVFSDKGIYRVFLLDPGKNTIASALVEII